MIPFGYIPPPPLSEFVELFWLYDGQSWGSSRERVLPTGTTELVIDLAGEARELDGRPQRSPFACVGGPRSEPFELAMPRRVLILGVHFRPGGAFPFVEPPAGELRNLTVPLDALWSDGGVEQLRERLLEAPTHAARLRVMEKVLLERAARPLERDPAVAYALRAFQKVSHTHTVERVTRRLGMMPRRFVRLFNDEVGLTPKLYSRVCRFQRALRAIGRGERPDWTEVALACGYYDQAHFNNDFREFSGLTPTDYARRQGEHFNHIPLAE